MASKTNVSDIAVAVLGALVIGVPVGLGVGFAARSLELPTGFVGPLTGGLVAALVTMIYRLREKRRSGGA